MIFFLPGYLFAPSCHPFEAGSFHDAPYRIGSGHFLRWQRLQPLYALLLKRDPFLGMALVHLTDHLNLVIVIACGRLVL